MNKISITKLSKEEIKERKIDQWPIWEKEISRFDWEYTTDEECLIIEGEVAVEMPEGIFNIKAGDFVTFKSGLKCIWNVKSKIRKYYNFK